MKYLNTRQNVSCQEPYAILIGIMKMRSENLGSSIIGYNVKDVIAYNRNVSKADLKEPIQIPFWVFLILFIIMIFMFYWCKILLELILIAFVITVYWQNK